MTFTSFGMTVLVLPEFPFPPTKKLSRAVCYSLFIVTCMMAIVMMVVVSHPTSFIRNNYFGNFLNMVSAISCLAGSYLPLGEEECKLCPAGTFSLGGGQRIHSFDPLPSRFLDFSTWCEDLTTGQRKSDCTGYAALNLEHNYFFLLFYFTLHLCRVGCLKQGFSCVSYVSVVRYVALDVNWIQN